MYFKYIGQFRVVFNRNNELTNTYSIKSIFKRLRPIIMHIESNVKMLTGALF